MLGDDHLDLVITARPRVGQYLASEQPRAAVDTRFLIRTAGGNTDTLLVRTTSTRIDDAQLNLHRRRWATYRLAAILRAAVTGESSRRGRQQHHQSSSRYHSLDRCIHVIPPFTTQIARKQPNQKTLPTPPRLAF